MERKRIFLFSAIFIATIMTFSFSGCGGSAEPTAIPATTSAPIPEPTSIQDNSDTELPAYDPSNIPDSSQLGSTTLFHERAGENVTFLFLRSFGANNYIAEFALYPTDKFTDEVPSAEQERALDSEWRPPPQSMPFLIWLFRNDVGADTFRAYLYKRDGQDWAFIIEDTSPRDLSKFFTRVLLEDDTEFSRLFLDWVQSSGASADDIRAFFN